MVAMVVILVIAVAAVSIVWGTASGFLERGNQASFDLANSLGDVHVTGCWVDRDRTYLRMSNKGEKAVNASAIDLSVKGLTFDPVFQPYTNVSTSIVEPRDSFRLMIPEKISEELDIQLYLGKQRKTVHCRYLDEVSCRPEEAMVGYWTLNSKHTLGATSVDLTEVQDNGDIQGAKVVKGFIGQAYEFDGSNDRVKIDNFPSDATGNVTISMWFNRTDVPFADDEALIALDGNVNNAPGVEIYLEDGLSGTPHGGLKATNNMGEELVTDTYQLDDGEWHHVALVINGDSFANANLWVDGENETLWRTAEPIDIDSDTSYLGYSYIANEDRWFTGRIDQVRIYNRSLKNWEVRNLYFHRDKEFQDAACSLEPN